METHVCNLSVHNKEEATFDFSPATNNVADSWNEMVGNGVDKCSDGCTTGLRLHYVCFNVSSPSLTGAFGGLWNGYRR